MKLSVAVCTYNGERYVQDQLTSILQQTMPVDEIVVCDDGSSDGTQAIVEDIAKKNDPIIRFYRNENRLGFKANFFSAIEQCSGDLVFLSDQDDVWHPNKVESVVQWFERHPDKKTVFTDAALINAEGGTIQGGLWEKVGFDSRKQRFFDHGFGVDLWMWSNRATGATMAIKKTIVDTTLWKRFSNGFHDSIIAWLGVAKDDLGYLPEKLMDYRLHQEQTCGVELFYPEFYGSPLKPCYKGFLYDDFMEQDVKLLPNETQKRVEFVLQRASLKYSWFGLKQLRLYPTYFHMYGCWAYKFICYDLWASIRHSIKRIIK